HRVKASGGQHGTRVFIYDTAGRVIEEVDQSGNLLNQYTFLGNEHLFRADTDYNIYFDFSDALDTSRQESLDGNLPCYDADYFPWGAEQQIYTNTCPTSQNYKFTGKEHDPDMGVDYFGARFYEGAMGRFYSPDW